MLLVDARGVPLSIIVSAANCHDVTQLVPTLDAVVVARPGVTARLRQHLCADAAASAARPPDRTYSIASTRPMCARVARSAPSALKASVRGVGWSRWRIPGLRAFASCWSPTKSCIDPMSHSPCSPLPLSASGMYRRRQTLFTDKI
jgi:hypothetical protein